MLSVLRLFRICQGGLAPPHRRGEAPDAGSGVFRDEESPCGSLLRAQHDLDRSGRNVAAGVLVDVDALDNASVLRSIEDLVLGIFGLVQGQMVNALIARYQR